MDEHFNKSVDIFYNDIMNMSDELLKTKINNKNNYILNHLLELDINMFDTFRAKCKNLSTTLSESYPCLNDYFDDELVSFIKNFKFNILLKRVLQLPLLLVLTIKKYIKFDNRDLYCIIFLLFGDYVVDKLNVSREKISKLIFIVESENIPLLRSFINNEDVLNDVLLLIQYKKK